MKLDKQAAKYFNTLWEDHRGFMGWDWYSFAPAHILGLIPDIILPDRPETISEQVNARYSHGGGWKNFEGFTLEYSTEDMFAPKLTYPGDPPIEICAISACSSGELCILFEEAWVAAINPKTATYEIARMD